jgi:hypothetical protein
MLEKACKSDNLHKIQTLYGMIHNHHRDSATIWRTVCKAGHADIIAYVHSRGGVGGQSGIPYIRNPNVIQLVQQLEQRNTLPSIERAITNNNIPMCQHLIKEYGVQLTDHVISMMIIHIQHTLIHWICDAYPMYASLIYDTAARGGYIMEMKYIDQLNIPINHGTVLCNTQHMVVVTYLLSYCTFDTTQLNLALLSRVEDITSDIEPICSALIKHGATAYNECLELACTYGNKRMIRLLLNYATNYDAVLPSIMKLDITLAKYIQRIYPWTDINRILIEACITNNVLLVEYALELNPTNTYEAICTACKALTPIQSQKICLLIAESAIKSRPHHILTPTM